MSNLRLRLREIGEEYGLTRYAIGRAAGCSNPTMDDLWLRPESANPQLQTLKDIADALTKLLRDRGVEREITVLDLLEISETST